MCAAVKRFLLFLLAALLFSFMEGVLRAEEPGPWFLISEAELRSIEEYRAKSEAEKQTWLSQVRELRARAENSEARSARLKAGSEILNSQLANQRGRNQKLQQSFNEYEAEWLALISLKNGEIDGLKREAADQTLNAERYKGIARLRLAIIIAMILVIAGYAAFKAHRSLL